MANRPFASMISRPAAGSARHASKRFLRRSPKPILKPLAFSSLKYGRLARRSQRFKIHDAGSNHGANRVSYVTTDLFSFLRQNANGRAPDNGDQGQSQIFI